MHELQITAPECVESIPASYVRLRSRFAPIAPATFYALIL